MTHEGETDTQTQSTKHTQRAHAKHTQDTQSTYIHTPLPPLALSIAHHALTPFLLPLSVLCYVLCVLSGGHHDGAVDQRLRAQVLQPTPLRRLQRRTAHGKRHSYIFALMSMYRERMCLYLIRIASRPTHVHAFHPSPALFLYSVPWLKIKQSLPLPRSPPLILTPLLLFSAQQDPEPTLPQTDVDLTPVVAISLTKTGTLPAEVNAPTATAAGGEAPQATAHA